MISSTQQDTKRAIMDFFYKINQVVLYVTLRGRIRKYYLKSTEFETYKIHILFFILHIYDILAT